MRKTITFLGDTAIFFPDVIEVLMKQDLRLLFVFEDEIQNLNFQSRLERTEAIAEIEFTSCERDGCWEADIIVITQPEKLTSTILEKIKEVATQKIVVIVASEEKESTIKFSFRELLPFSKIVEIEVIAMKKEISFCSRDTEAKAEVQKIFEA